MIERLTRFSLLPIMGLLLLSPTGLCARSGPGSLDFLMPDAEIAATTFVALDFAKFPALPPNRIPETRTIFVSKRGTDAGAGTMDEPFFTIAHAVRAARSGDTVVVRGGTYAEAWEPDDYRALVLTQKDLTLMAYPGERVSMRPAENVTYGIVVTARNLVVRGIDLEGFESVGILFEAGAKQNRNIVIADLEITGCEEAIAMWEAASAVDRLLLANLRTEAIVHCGVGPCSHWRLENVTIDAKGEGWGADAFAIESGDNILLVNTQVLGAGSDGIDTKATRVVVLDSRVEGVENNAVKLWHGGDVINTVIERGWQNPLVVEEGRFRLLNSTVGYPPKLDGHRDYSMILGYDLRRPMQIEIVNSIIANPSGGAWINPETTSVSIRNSLFYTADGSETLIHGDFVARYRKGTAGINRRYGSANLTADPLLDRKLRPAATSPAIDAGIALLADFPLRDIKGKPRFQGAAPDLGAYEAGDGAPTAPAPPTPPSLPAPPIETEASRPSSPSTTAAPGTVQVPPSLAPGAPPSLTPESAPAGSGPVPFPVPGVAYFEDFDDPLGPSWQFVGTGMRVDSQRLTCRRDLGDAPSGGRWALPPMAVYTLSLDYTHGTGVGAVALPVSSREPPAFYRVWLIDDRVEIVRGGHDEEPVVEARAPYSLTRGETYAVRVEVSGGRLDVVVNARPVLTWIDPHPLPSGFMGFGCGVGTGFAFDNITVTSSATSTGSRIEMPVNPLMENAPSGFAPHDSRKKLLRRGYGLGSVDPSLRP